MEHGIRGAESREDARFASDLCERLNIPCHVHSVDVPQYAKSHGLGLEEAARILRYEAFEKEVARILRYEAFEEEAGRYPCETADASDQSRVTAGRQSLQLRTIWRTTRRQFFSDASRKRSEGTRRHASGFREERCHLYQAAFISNTRTDRGISKGKRTGFCHRCHKH